MALAVATCIEVSVFVIPGPEAATTTPGLRLTYPQADAMNAADSSWRQPTTFIPSSTAPAKTSIIGPPTTPKMVSMPAAASCLAVI